MMMHNEKVEQLLKYLDILSKLNEGMYHCTTEIDKAIKAIEKELNI